MYGDWPFIGSYPVFFYFLRGHTVPLVAQYEGIIPQLVPIFVRAVEKDRWKFCSSVYAIGVADLYSYDGPV